MSKCDQPYFRDDIFERSTNGHFNGTPCDLEAQGQNLLIFAYNQRKLCSDIGEYGDCRSAWTAVAGGDRHCIHGSFGAIAQEQTG
jgi:hypothetical protein